MKKTFRSILAGAVALLAVSCYDDSGLRKDIQKLDDRVTAIEAALNAEVNGINDLATRLAAAEQALSTTNTTVANLVTKLDAVDGKVDGKVADFDAAIATLTAADKTLDDKIVAAIAKIAVVKVEEKDGNVVLTLADNTTVALSKPLSNVENSGLVTITEDNMWAVVEADGTVKSLDVPVGHPDVTIEFQVASDGNLQYSVNDGEWMNTGVNTSDISGQKYVINSLQVSEDEKCVAITIGESEFFLPLYVPTPSVRLKGGLQYFGYGESKQVSVAIEGVDNLLVMNQPYGWKASIKGSTLTVTAPSEGNVDAEKTGSVVLHGDSNGACVTAVLNVILGTGFQLSVDDEGLITVVNPIIVHSFNAWTGMEYNGFCDYAIGVAKTSVFEEYSSTAEFYKAVMNDYQGLTGFSAFAKNIGLVNEYDAELHPVDVVKVNVAELPALAYSSYEIEKGERYVVWIVPQPSEEVDGSEMLFTYYEPVAVELETTKLSFDEVELVLSLYGADAAYVGAVCESDLTMTGAQDFATYMELGWGYGGPWAQFTQGGYFEALGMPAVNGDTVSVSEIVYGCVPGTKYYVYVVPVTEGKAPAEYVFEKDCRVYEFTTSALVEGAEDAELTFNEEKTDYTSVTVDVTLAEGTKAYYKFYEVGALDGQTDADVISDMLSYGATELYESESVKESYLSAGESVMLVVLSITEEGKYSIVKGVYTSKVYPIVETIAVNVESATKGDDGKLTAVFSVSGATKVAVYYYYSSNYSSFNNYLMQKTTTYFYADVVDGKATITGIPKNELNESYYLIFTAYNEDGAGNVTEFAAAKNVQIKSLLPAAE